MTCVSFIIIFLMLSHFHDVFATLVCPTGEICCRGWKVILNVLSVKLLPTRVLQISSLIVLIKKYFLYGVFLQKPKLSIFVLEVLTYDKYLHTTLFRLNIFNNWSIAINKLFKQSFPWPQYSLTIFFLHVSL